jgi:hypothetical protein
MSAVATASPQETARPAPLRTGPVPRSRIGLPPAPVDVSAALVVDATAHPVLLFREPIRHPA